MDGGSRDESLNIIRRYESKISFWISRPDQGQSHALNQGFARSSGRIMGWLNADDRLQPGALRLVAGCLNLNRPAWLVGSSFMMDENEKSRYVRHAECRYHRKDLLQWHKNWFAQPSVFWNRELWQLSGGLNPSLHFAQDLDLWLRMSEHCCPEIIRQTLSACCFHPDAKGFRFRYEVALAMHRIIRNACGKDQKKPLRLYTGLWAKCFKDLAKDFCYARLRKAKPAGHRDRLSGGPHS